MYKLVSLGEFRDSFRKSSYYNSKYSYKGLEVIYNILEDYYNGMYNLNMAEIAGAFTEYESLEEYNEDYFGSYKDDYFDTIETIDMITYRIDSESFLTVEPRLIYQKGLMSND